MDIIKFIKISLSKYINLSIKDENTLYFITDTKEIMLGGVRYLSDRLNPNWSTNVFISPNGNDNKDGFNPYSPMKTISGAISKYGCYPDLTLNLLEGTYDAPANSMTTLKSLSINNYTSDKTKVTIYGAMQFYHCILSVNNITMSMARPANGLNLIKVQANITNCVFNTSYIGIDCNSGCNVIIEVCQFNKNSVAVNASSLCNVYCSNAVASTTENINDIAFKVRYGSTLIKNGTIPYARNPNVVDTGSIIR